MKKHILPAAARICELLAYEPETGLLWWRKPAGRRRPAGAIAGANTGPYRTIGVDGTQYLAHRLIARMYLNISDGDLVDHRDGNGRNNRLTNLRVAKRGQRDNCQNAALSRANRTGYTGVFFEPSRGRFQAAIVVDRRKIHLGRYDTAEAAADAYAAAKRKFHKFQPTPVGPR